MRHRLFVTAALLASLTSGCSGRDLDLFDHPDGGSDLSRTASDGGSDLSQLVDVDMAQQPSAWTLLPSVTTTDLYSVVVGNFGTEVIAVGGTPGSTATPGPGVIVHYDGSAWSATPNLVNLRSVSGSWNMNGLWAVGEYGGEGSTITRTGATWAARNVVIPGSVNGVFYPITSLDSIYAVGDGGKVLYSEGAHTTWAPATTGTTEPMYAVWGSSYLDVYAVGKNGTVLHRTGASGVGTWTLSMPAFADLHGVWGSSANDVYIVGGDSSGTIGNGFHSTDGGSTWTPITTATTAMYAVWGTSSTDVYAVGAGGGIYHTTGNNVWTVETSPTTKDLLGIWGSPSAGIYIVGRGGTILHK